MEIYRPFKIAFLAVVTVGVIVGLFLFTAVVVHHKRGGQWQQNECTNDRAPCIRMVDGKGTEVARFNDFRFDSGRCLLYDRLSDHKWVRYCGVYNLQWIGPSGAES